MALIIFTAEQVKELEKNPYVTKASEKSITYTDEFKEYFVEAYERGKRPSQILREAGFDPRMLGNDRIDGMRKRYKKMAERPEGLRDTRKGGLGRQRTKDLTAEEQIQRLKHKVRYLEQENAFLKKIEFLDKKARQEQSLMTSSESSGK